MNPFEFATAQQILFGQGKIEQLPKIAKTHAIRRALLVTSKTTDRFQSVLDQLQKAEIELTIFAVPTEPSLPLIRDGVQRAKEASCDGVIAIGGGSVLDTGKAIAALMRNTGDILDYLEVVGQGRPLEQPSAPCIAVATTSGTGAEVTRNAVIYAPEHKVKVSLRSASMLPVAAIVDPSLTLDLSPRQTAWSGMDALTQLIEPYVSIRANALTDSLCLQAIPLAAEALPKVFTEGHNLEARSQMALASLFGGLSLANAGLGIVHGFAGPLGGMFDAPHGAICAALLPHGMAANISHVEREQYKDPRAAETLSRYRTLARLLTANPSAEPQDGVAFVHELSKKLEIGSLSTFGMTEKEETEVVEKARKASSMKANPVVLSEEEIRAVYSAAL